MIGVPDFDNASDFIAPILNLGYEYISEYENIMPFRRFFIKWNDEIRTHHIHLVELNTEFWKRHLSFRNHLRTNTIDRESYGKLKTELSLKEWESRDGYSKAKSSFIQGIESKSCD